MMMTMMMTMMSSTSTSLAEVMPLSHLCFNYFDEDVVVFWVTVPNEAYQVPGYYVLVPYGRPNPIQILLYQVLVD
jgi:hypothetical protein